MGSARPRSWPRRRPPAPQAACPACLQPSSGDGAAKAGAGAGQGAGREPPSRPGTRGPGAGALARPPHRAAAGKKPGPMRPQEGPERPIRATLSLTDPQERPKRPIRDCLLLLHLWEWQLCSDWPWEPPCSALEPIRSGGSSRVTRGSGLPVAGKNEVSGAEAGRIGRGGAGACGALGISPPAPNVALGAGRHGGTSRPASSLRRRRVPRAELRGRQLWRPPSPRALLRAAAAGGGCPGSRPGDASTTSLVAPSKRPPGVAMGPCAVGCHELPGSSKSLATAGMGGGPLGYPHLEPPRVGRGWCSTRYLLPEDMGCWAAPGPSPCGNTPATVRQGESVANHRGLETQSTGQSLSQAGVRP